MIMLCRMCSLHHCTMSCSVIPGEEVLIYLSLEGMCGTKRHRFCAFFYLKWGKPFDYSGLYYGRVYVQWSTIRHYVILGRIFFSHGCRSPLEK